MPGAFLSGFHFLKSSRQNSSSVSRVDTPSLEYIFYEVKRRACEDFGGWGCFLLNIGLSLWSSDPFLATSASDLWQWRGCTANISSCSPRQSQEVSKDPPQVKQEAFMKMKFDDWKVKSSWTWIEAALTGWLDCRGANWSSN